MRTVIFSRGRSGSSSLNQALREHLSLQSSDEPFNPKNFDGRYVVNTPQDVRDKLEEIWQEHQLIKHVWANWGWPFEGPQAIACNQEILNCPDTAFVLLNRRNVLQRFVSAHIAHVAQEWQINCPTDREKFMELSYPPIDHRPLREVLTSELSTIAANAAKLQAAGKRFIHLWYEDFYSEKLTIAEKLAAYERLLEWLNLPKDQYCQETVGRILNFENRKVSTESIYRLIPNAEEIDRLYGCYSTGYLFSSPPIESDTPTSTAKSSNRCLPRLEDQSLLRQLISPSLCQKHQLSVAGASGLRTLFSSQIIVAMVAHNASNTAREAIVAAESLADGFLFIDDASTDKTCQELYSAKPYLTLKRQSGEPPENRATGREALIDIANTLPMIKGLLRWLIWVDADEIIEHSPENVARVRSFLSDTRCPVRVIEAPVTHLVDSRDLFWANYPLTNLSGISWSEKGFLIDPNCPRNAPGIQNQDGGLPLVPYEYSEKEIARIELLFQHLGHFSFANRYQQYQTAPSEQHLLSFGSALHLKPLCSLDLASSSKAEKHRTRLDRFRDHTELGKV